MAHVILFGNEKGGSGKTTYAIHTIVSLLSTGFSVASIDLDERQQSLSRYIENRQKMKAQYGINLLLPEHFQISSKVSADTTDYQDIILQLMQSLQNYDYIVIDAPGSNTGISRFAHIHADTVITPINSSFIDVDLLGKIDANTLEMTSPGVYGTMYMSSREKRKIAEKSDAEWIVVHSRYSIAETINRRSIDFALRCMAKHMNFKVIRGFTERSIFKELFLQGLTLSDAALTKQINITPSVIAARQEIRNFLASLNL